MSKSNGKVILEFTLNGKKHTYLNRLDMFGNPLTTTNKSLAKGIKKGDLANVCKRVIGYFGKDYIKDMNVIDV